MTKKYSSTLQDNAHYEERRERHFEKELDKNTAQFEMRMQDKTNIDPILTESDDQDFIAKTRQSTQRSIVLPKNPLLSSPRISATADRLGLSSRARTMFVASIIKESGGNLEDYSISQTSSLTSGSSIRKDLSKSIAESFKAPQFSVLHWDRKIIPNELRKKTNRLAIVISGPPDNCKGKLLGALCVANVTGEAEANSTHQVVKSLGYFR